MTQECIKWHKDVILKIYWHQIAVLLISHTGSPSGATGYLLECETRGSITAGLMSLEPSSLQVGSEGGSEGGGERWREERIEFVCSSTAASDTGGTGDGMLGICEDFS